MDFFGYESGTSFDIGRLRYGGHNSLGSIPIFVGPSIVISEVLSRGRSRPLGPPKFVISLRLSVGPISFQKTFSREGVHHRVIYPHRAASDVPSDPLHSVPLLAPGSRSGVLKTAVIDDPVCTQVRADYRLHPQWTLLECTTSHDSYSPGGYLTSMRRWPGMDSTSDPHPSFG